MSKIYRLSSYFIGLFIFAAPYLLYGQHEQGTTGLLLPNRDSINKIPFDIVGNKINKWNNKPVNSFDLRRHFPPAMSQKDQGSCVAFALSYNLISYIEKVILGYSYNVVNSQPDFSKVYSPSFVFNGVKAQKGIDGCISGIEFYDAFKFIEDKGAVKWSVFPYNGAVDQCNIKIPNTVYSSANDLLGYVFYRTDPSLETLKFYISSYNPVIIGIYTSKGMYDEGKKYNVSKSTNKFVWQPAQNDKDAYHAMLCVGYDDMSRRFILLNSWGSDWGENGFCYIPYNVFYERTREFYIAKPENRHFSSAGSKAMKIMGTFKGEIPAYDFRDSRTKIDTLFKADLDMLRAVANRTDAQNKLLQQLETYFK